MYLSFLLLYNFFQFYLIVKIINIISFHVFYTKEKVLNFVYFSGSYE